MLDGPVNFDLYSVGIAIISSLVLGLLVFRQNTRNATNRLFLFFVLANSAWSILNYLSYQVVGLEIGLWFVRLVLTFAVIQSYFFFLLMHTFPSTQLKIKKWPFLLATLTVLLVIFLTLTPAVFSEVVYTPGVPPTPTVAPGIGLFALTTITLVVSGIVFLAKKHKLSTGLEKKRYRLLSWGVISMFSLIVVFNFIFPVLLGFTRLIPFGALFTLPFVVCTSYAIIRHELFNVKVIAAQALTVVIWIVLFSKIFVSPSNSARVVDLLIFLLTVLFGILLVRSVRNEVEQRERLQVLTEKLRAIDKQKDEFISMAAHELRAPMTAIKGYISMIMEGDTGDIPDKARDYLTDVTSVNDRLIRLVNNMLNVSRIEEGRLVYKTEIVKLSDIANSVFKSFKFEAKRKGLEFAVSVPENLKDSVWVDGDRLTEVVGNFVSNSVKYTESGRIDIVITQPTPDRIRLAVKDTGPGISKAEQKKLFQKFFRVKSTAGKTIGTGLGLYISKLLIEKFNGEIGLNSAAGKGSEFWFELPVTEKAPKQAVEFESQREDTNMIQESDKTEPTLPTKDKVA